MNLQIYMYNSRTKRKKNRMSDFLSGRGGLLGVFSVETGRFLLENQVTCSSSSSNSKSEEEEEEGDFVVVFSSSKSVHNSSHPLSTLCYYTGVPAAVGESVRDLHVPHATPTASSQTGTRRFFFYFSVLFSFLFTQRILCVLLCCVCVCTFYTSPPPTTTFFPDNNNNPVAPFDDVAIWRPFSNFVGGFPGNASKKKPKVVGRSFFSRNVLMLHHIFFFSKKNKIKQNKNPT
jgi:hypothetical protein